MDQLSFCDRGPLLASIRCVGGTEGSRPGGQEGFQALR